MLKVKKFDSDYGYIKQELPEKLVFNIGNKKDFTIYESYLNNEDYKIDTIYMDDCLIGIIESNEIDFYMHIKKEVLYVTPYLNDKTEGSLDISIIKCHNRFTIEKTMYSYLVIDNYTKQRINLDAKIFLEGRKPFLIDTINEDGDPFIYLKITYSKYVTFLEYTNSKKDFAFKTIKLNIITSSQLTYDFNSANELIIQSEENSQIFRLNELNKCKDLKLTKNFKKYIQDGIYIKINGKIYIINEHNDKLSIKTDNEKQLLYKYSNISLKKKGKYINIRGEIFYNTKIKPNTLVTKKGMFLSNLNWISETEFICKLKINQLRRLNEIHNTIFLAINNKKLHPLHQSKILNDKRKVLLSFNTKKSAIIIRRNAVNNISIGNLRSLKIYKTSHKFKINTANIIANLYKLFRKKTSVNLFFEKEASKAVESGKYVFESIANNKNFNSKNIFILDEKSKQYPEMKTKWKDKIVKRFSFKNYLYIFLADYFISSELSNHVINTRIFNDKLNEKIKATPLYFLQHGITYLKPRDDYQNVGFHKKNMTNNIVKSVVSSDAESQIFNKLGYNDFEIMKTGMPKFDYSKLVENADKITYMPTWRPWEESQVLNGNIKETTYYQSLMNIINSFEKAGMLDRLQIAAHNKFSEFAKEHFKKYKDIFVEDPTNTLTNSAIYITDISSIILDATYRGAYPIFYWKDFDTLIEKHGGTTPVNEKNAPGSVVYSEEDLIKLVKKVINNKYKIPKEIIENYKKINEFNDNRNTERVVNELIKDNVL